MPAAIDEFANQVAGRLWQLAAAKITARVELEVFRAQAELLQQAAAFRRSHGELGEQVARRLELASQRLVRDVADEDDDLEWSGALSAPVFNPAAADVPKTHMTDPLGKRGRGRPKKAVADGADSKAPASNDGIFTQIHEGTNEERTGARDPAGTDQVPDFPA